MLSVPGRRPLKHDPAMVARCFLANIFLRARTLPTFVAYWHTQLLPVQAGTVYADVNESQNVAVNSFRHALTLLSGTLFDVVLTGQEKAMPLATDTEPRPFCLINFLFAPSIAGTPQEKQQQPLILTIDDELLSNSAFWADEVDARPIQALEAYTTMTAWPEVYWRSAGNMGMGGNIEEEGFVYLPETREALADLMAPGALIVLFCHHVIELFFRSVAKLFNTKQKEQQNRLPAKQQKLERKKEMLMEARQIVALAQELRVLVTPGRIKWADWIPERERRWVEQDLYTLLDACTLTDDVPLFLEKFQRLRHHVLMHCAAKYEQESDRAVRMNGLPLLSIDADDVTYRTFWEAIRSTDDV